MLCVLCSDHIKTVTWSTPENQLKIDYICVKCNFGSNSDQNSMKQSILQSGIEDNLIIISDVLHPKNPDANLNEILKIIWRFSKSTNIAVLKRFMKVTLSLSKHFDTFHRLDMVREWIMFAGHDDKDVRKEFSLVIYRILASCQVSKI